MKWDKSYYKLGQVTSGLLQSGADITNWDNFIRKWSNYCIEDQYIFLTLGQIDTHSHRKGQCGSKVKLYIMI